MNGPIFYKLELGSHPHHRIGTDGQRGAVLAELQGLRSGIAPDDIQVYLPINCPPAVGEAKAREENENKGPEAERKEGKKEGATQERRKEGMMEG